MERQQFYEFSTKLNALVPQVKELVRTHAFRYAMIADNSSRGLDCPYAQQSLRFHCEEGEMLALRAKLLVLQELVNSLCAQSE